MEVQTVNNVSLNRSLISPTAARHPSTPSSSKKTPTTTSSSTKSLVKKTQNTSGSSSSSTNNAISNNKNRAYGISGTAAPQKNSRSESPASSANSAHSARSGHSDIEKELQSLDLHGSLCDSGSLSLGAELIFLKSNGSLSASSSVSTSGGVLGVDTGSTAVDGEDDDSPTGSTENAPNGVTLVNDPLTTNGVSSGTANVSITTIGAIAATKKRIVSSRTPTRKARRIKFYRNGDRFHPGITIPVSNERYRSFESLCEDLTRSLEDTVKIPGAVRSIFNLGGKKVGSLDELEDGQSYVCSCNNENFKKVEYNTASQPLAQLTTAVRPQGKERSGPSAVTTSANLTGQNMTTNTTATMANVTTTTTIAKQQPHRPSSPMKNSSSGSSVGGINTVNNGNSTTVNVTNGSGSPVLQRLMERDSVVRPRIVTLIRNGTRPRKIMRLLLNKRNSPSFDHVLTAVTQVVRLDTGYVRKMFTLSGAPLLQLADFFAVDDVFFAYGTERVNHPDDLRLEPDEQRAIQAIRKTLRTAGSACRGPKPQMPVKSKNLHAVSGYEQPANNKKNAAPIAPIPNGSASDNKAGGDNSASNGIDIYREQVKAAEHALLNEMGVEPNELPVAISERYELGPVIGDGNFAVVLQIHDRRNGQPYALKVIDKSKCRGKEHYIDAEVRVMKKLQHPHIISLLLDVDRAAHMFLVLEYVSGGDLFDAITRVTRFSEAQACVMIRHLASAMAYLHSISVVHRDIKPENLLVELDEHGNVIELKLADFGLACEVTEPLFAVCGTPTYVAPEILMETGYGLKIDVWAAGIILYILLCGFPPFVSQDNMQEPLFDAIIAGVYEFPDPYWSDIGEGVRDLIANMLQSDPDVRFTSEDILDHSWTMEAIYANNDGRVYSS